MSSKEKYKNFIKQIPKEVTLIAVSKTKTAEEIMELYAEGHRDFGENYVQELISKYESLPKDIRWHFIGHLQTNKVKFITPFVHLIHSVDSLRLLQEINKQGEKINRSIDCLIQIYVGNEETKFGLNLDEVKDLILMFEEKKHSFAKIKGLMGMASNTDNEIQIKNEFNIIKDLFVSIGESKHCKMEFLSMGMSSDFNIAIQSGSNMIRVGSLIFGERNYIK